VEHGIWRLGNLVSDVRVWFFWQDKHLWDWRVNVAACDRFCEVKKIRVERGRKNIVSQGLCLSMSDHVRHLRAFTDSDCNTDDTAIICHDVDVFRYKVVDETVRLASKYLHVSHLQCYWKRNGVVSKE
jgi:hypothetical protein